MNKPRLIIPVLLAIFSFKCKPAPVDFSAHTQFVPVLEADVAQGKNIIYAASFALAWEGVRDKTGKPENMESAELKLMEQPGSYKGTLANNEFSGEATANWGKIRISSSFERKLTFSYPMDTVEGRFKFNGESVRSFGRLSYAAPIDKEIDIVYFKNDDEFIVKIKLREPNEEMIFAKGFSQSPRLSVALDSIYAAMEAGRSDTAESSRWKHVYSDFDQVVIPDVRFDLDNNFRGIEETHFEAGNKRHEIVKAQQRIALVLSEYGTRPESVVELVDRPTLYIEAPDVMPTVKHMLFNKPFFMILKKSNVRNPYFMMKVENTAFMTKVDY